MEDFEQQAYDHIYDHAKTGYTSDCCHSIVLYEDICSECGEHCNPIEDEEE